MDIVGRILVFINITDMTIAEFAYAAGLSEDTIKAIIYHRVKDIKLSTDVKLANVMGCSIDELISDNTASSHLSTTKSARELKVEGYIENDGGG